MALITTQEEYNMENTALRTVSPNGAKKSIMRAFKKKRPVFMWGPPGIGKSDIIGCLLYTSPSPRDVEESRMPSSA